MRLIIMPMMLIIFTGSFKRMIPQRMIVITRNNKIVGIKIAALIVGFMRSIIVNMSADPMVIPAPAIAPIPGRVHNCCGTVVFFN